jgi:hypothetical protein
MLAGAAVAGADTDSGPSSGSATSSESAKPDTGQAPNSSDTKPNSSGTKPNGRAKPDTGRADTGNGDERSGGRPRRHPAAKPADTHTDVDNHEPVSGTAAAAAEAEHVDKKSPTDRPVPSLSGTDAERSNRLAAKRSESNAQATAPGAADPIGPRPDVEATHPTPIAVATTALRANSAASVAPAKTAAAPQPSLVGLISSPVFNVLSTAERLVNGPPTVPPNSTVTVRSSTLDIGSGLVVPADWYYPAGDKPPTRMILLQHGFLAIGPMYSYTAANLAERTNSIVVTPTLTSNPLADGALWLGGAGMHEAIANLFVGNRDALTASAVAAGYADQYHLDPAQAALPRQFALAGHSLGGALVSGVAGYLADNGAAADLVGVILLDGVPTGDQLPGALVKLKAYEAKTGRFIPVREIGAPLNIWNAPSNANEALSAARPDRYVGVVLDGGVHMDSMQGGNPLIQFVAYVAAGFPQKQNPPAVQELSVTWLNQWFTGRTDIGDDLVPGSTITIDTPQGPASAVVIGNAPAVTSSSRRLERAA